MAVDWSLQGDLTRWQARLVALVGDADGLIDDLERGDRLGLPLDPHLAEHLIGHARAGEAPGVLPDEHVPRCARRLQPCRSVQHVADEVDVVRSDDELTGVDPDPQAQLDAVPVPKAMPGLISITMSSGRAS